MDIYHLDARFAIGTATRAPYKKTNGTRAAT
jgi:hypothetical protein